MNKSHITVWNEANGSWVATSAHTRTRGTRSKSRVVAGSVAAALGMITGYSGVAEAVVTNPVGNYGNLVVNNVSSVTKAASASGGSIAIGGGATASGETGYDGSSAVAIGEAATVNGGASMALGESSSVTGNKSVALGSASTVTADNSVALGPFSTVTASNSVALGSYSVADRENTVSVGTSTSHRQIVNVAAGTQSTDAVNLSQLDGVVGALGGGMVINQDGTITAPDYSVGGTTVHSVGNALSNIDARTTRNTADVAGNTSAIGALDTRVGAAENSIAKHTSDIAANNSMISNIDGRVSSVEGSVTNLTQQLNSGAVGLVKQDTGTQAITVASETGGKSVDITGTEGARTLSGVKEGKLEDGSTEAVNGSQLAATNDRVSTAEGKIAQNASDITNVQNQLSSGTIGLVQQDAATSDITVGKDAGGTVVNMAGTAGNRTVTGVAAGAVNAGSTDAINGSQMYANSAGVAAALGGGSTVNGDGTITAPSYSVGGTTVHSVGDAVSNIDDRTTKNTSDIKKIQGQVGDVGAQLSGAVQYDRNADGSVNFSSVTLGGISSAGPVVLSNVANGMNQYDAVNYGQLSALQAQVDGLDGQVSDLNTQLSNTPPSTPSGDSDRAVANVAAPGTGAGSTAVGANATALADNTTALGANASAMSANSTAIGSGSQATGSNSVALGTGSVADRDNSVSVGSVGNERQITNVAAGTAPTDAVNMGQLYGVRSEMDKLRKDAMGGISSAMALANLPQSVLPGRTMVAMGTSTYGGQVGAALGMSYMTRDNKWTVKGAATTSTRGEVGAALSAGFYF